MDRGATSATSISGTTAASEIKTAISEEVAKEASNALWLYGGKKSMQNADVTGGGGAAMTPMLYEAAMLFCLDCWNK